MPGAGESTKALSVAAWLRSLGIGLWAVALVAYAVCWQCVTSMLALSADLRTPIPPSINGVVLAARWLPAAGLLTACVLAFAIRRGAATRYAASGLLAAISSTAGLLLAIVAATTEL